MTENNSFNAPTDMDGQNHMTTDGNFSLMTCVSLAQPNSLGTLNHQNQIMESFPVLSMLQGEPVNDLHADLNLTNRFGILDCDSLIPRNIVNTPLGNSCQISNAEVHERFMNGLPISASSLSALFAAKCIPHENGLKTFSSNDYADTLKSSFEASMNCGCEEMLVDMNNKWGCNKFLSPPEVVGKVQPFQLIGNMELNGLMLSESADMNSQSFSGSSKFSNGLSLSLSTYEPSVIRGTPIPDQCSEVSYSCVTRNPHLGSEQTSCNSKNLALSSGSYRSVGLSELLYGSKYLHVIQEILAQIASYSLENVDQISYSALGSDGNNRFEVQMDPMLQGQEIEAKKKQLLALLQVVDDRYNQCLDEVHTVISAFHAATELDPRVHARFSLQTISFLYKNLRERISNQILAMGAHFSEGDPPGEEGGSFESSFIQKQWALQHLRRKDHQLWRPQRGLPERSVSVLRAWMFQNFLHPYPKDSEKHLLAVKSGLTRSQVSNWFINARVRLWKPMIEEMYCEMNRRKGPRKDEERDSNCRTLINIENHRFKMN